MYSIFKTFVLSLLMIAQVHFAYAQNAAILPPAKTTFLDSNGKPLTSGTVDFYIPGTSTRKTTWQDGAATIANANPVVLDAAGRALILGNGAYREVVKDRVGNLIWDQITNSAGAGGSGSVTVGDGNAVGTVLPYSGIVAPSNYAFPYGQELSRTTYVDLLSAITLSQNITCISGNATLTTVADTSQLNIGGAVEAACVPAGATILSKTVNTVTISANATVGVTTTATFFPWGNGNGLTTFNAPDLRGVVLPGRNNMGGSNSVNLSTPYYTDPNSIAGRGGSQNHTIITSEMASHGHTITDPGHIHIERGSGAGGVAGQLVTASGSGVDVDVPQSTKINTTGISINATGGGIAVSATVAAGGSGYTAGTQLLTVLGGTCTTQPQFNITTSAGAITAPVLVTAGQCSVVPANPASTSGGGGTLGTLNVIYSAVPFSLIQPSKTINYIVKISADVNLSIARCANLIDAGTACTRNVGTSGNTVPLLNTANSFSAAQIFSAGIAVSGGTTSITGLTTPTTPTDAATKAYVDSVATGLNILSQSRLASAAVLPNTPTYANGASGVGATLTAGSNTTLTVDGTLAALNDIILVKNQASAFQNGVYTLTQVGSGAAPWILTRATYFDQAAEMKAGSYTLITTGSTNAATSWALQTAVTTVGTDPLNWIQFSATAGVTSVGGFNGIVTAAQVTSSCNLFTGALSGCVPSGSGTTVVSQLNPTTQTWTTPTAVTLQSRATAASLNLTGVNTVKTLGYATAGDGGEATFKNVGSAAFIDSYITTFTITGGSGYTNGGPYYGNLFSVGTKPFAIGTVTVAGGAFTAVDVTGTPGGQCAVGDVLLFVGSAAVVGGVNGGMPAGGINGAITVTGCSTPLGSFTDTAGNHFQLVTPTGGNVMQFGAKPDWNGTDAGSTDNYNAFQAAFWYAGFKSSTSFDSGGFWGGKINVPQGSYMVLGTGLKPLIVPNGVRVMGDHGTASTIKFGTAWDATTVQLTLGDNNWHFACFNPSLYHMELRSDSGTGYMVYSNCGQDFAGLFQTYIYSNGSGTRPCLHYEKGFGGATVFIIRDVSCSVNSNSPMFWLGNTIASGLNLGSTMVEVTNISAGGNSGGAGNHQTATALLINGGFINVNRFHFEATAGGITVDIGATGNGDYVTIANVNGGGLPVFAPCPGQIILNGSNTINNTLLTQVQGSSTCTNVVTNGQAGGVSYNNAIQQPARFGPNYTSF